MNTPKAPAIWLSEHDVRNLVLSARKAKANLLAVIAGIDAKVEARRNTINSSLSDLSTKDRLAAVDASVSSLKATLKADSNKQRTEILRSIARMNEQAKGAVPFYESSVQMLLRDTIASTKRASVFQNLEAAGPVELKAFASLAVATGDKDMGPPLSAACTPSPRLPPGRSRRAPWPTPWWASSRRRLPRAPRGRWAAPGGCGLRPHVRAGSLRQLGPGLGRGCPP